ncbi:MAG: fumarylacetoacetate hydrolase family protein [Pyrinomonadaceae bacterium]|nr:fumarylacetoacetate hydrolase family protein [Pyrinomonadaceae bacterium]
MKLCRATHALNEQPRFGAIDGSTVHVFEAGVSLEALATSQSSHSVSLAEVTLVAPVTPSKIVCVGRNYREHAAELGNMMPEEPLLFLKAPSSVIGDGDTIELPGESERVEHEGELGVVIGHRARRISADEDPLSYVLGYTCVNDVTARDLQRKDVQFTRAKSFDTFCPVGPVIVRDINPLDAEVTTRLNGDIKQRARTSTMAFSVPFLIRYIAEIMTLYPGDLIATGTPAGVSPMKHGDVVEIEIEGIGVLRNKVN